MGYFSSQKCGAPTILVILKRYGGLKISGTPSPQAGMGFLVQKRRTVVEFIADHGHIFVFQNAAKLAHCSTENIIVRPWFEQIDTPQTQP